MLVRRIIVDPPPKPPAQEPEISITGTPNETTIRRGDVSKHLLSVNLDDPDKTVSEAVIFLYVGHVDTGTNGFQNFSNPSVEPNIFRAPVDGDLLRRGVASELRYTVNDNALLGAYDINIQIFKGSETNPGNVKQEDLLGIKNVRFYIED